GTFVNGQRVKVANLKDGDEIRGGRTIIRVSVETSPSEPSLPEVALQPPSAAASPPRARSQSTVEYSVSAQPSSSVSSAPEADPAPVSCPACATATVPPSGAPTVLCSTCLELAQQQAQSFSGYQLIRELGRGGMGVVYLALRESDQTLV